MTLAPDSVRTMFDRIAPVYDVMNHVMTAGLDIRWRRRAAEAAVRTGDRVLDAACGTGDLAIADLRAGAGKVTGLDFSPKMLERARAKHTSIEWLQGDMLALPFAAGAPSRRQGRDPGDHAAARRAAAVLFALVRPHRPAARQGPAGR